ncbi:hypothetical protein ACTFSP_03965 [Bacillus cereus group sp. MYBK108-2]|uniref:hypothetical protein n=1 Tax=unclassified Bacillus cereus group TaxID=2750818 RepID=UPI00288E73C1|nr:hypothetical protein [Bacillus cereus]HEF1897788.1 hypothetical protein [Bacillus cereus]
MNDLTGFIIYLLIMFILIPVPVYFLVTKIVVPILEKISKFMSSFLIKSFKKQLSGFLIVIEVIMLVATIWFIYTTFDTLLFKSEQAINKFVYVCSIYLTVIILFGSTLSNLRAHGVEYKGIIGKLSKKIAYKNFYIINRIQNSSKTLYTFLLYDLILFVIIVGITTFHNISIHLFYIFCLSIPIFLVMFVYLTRNKVEQNVRRIISYFLIIILVILKSFKDFSVLIELDIPNPITDYMTWISITIFTAMDRFIKAIIDDRNDWKKELEDINDGEEQKDKQHKETQINQQPVITPVNHSERRLLTDELKETYIIFENGIPKVELTKSDATFLMEQLNEIKEKKRNSNENLNL